MGETNSFYNGGAPGISNDFGTAILTLQYLSALAAHGAAGANFHGGWGSTGYSPIVVEFKSGVVSAVHAEYYSLLMFSQVGVGNTLNKTMSNALVHFTTVAVRRLDGSVSMVLANYDPPLLMSVLTSKQSLEVLRQLPF